MKLKSVEIVKDTPVYWQADIVFDNDGQLIKKTIYNKGFDAARDWVMSRMRQFMAVAREAERDYAYAMFGPDCVNNVARGPFSPMEMARLDDAAVLCPLVWKHEPWL
jgi:hypothetical protein